MIRFIRLWWSPFLTLVLGACGKASAPPPSEAEKNPRSETKGQAASIPKGEWAEVRRGNIQSSIPAVGMLRARQTTQLGPQISGRVERVLVNVGDKVKKGQDLIFLEGAFFEIERSQRSADLAAAKASLWETEVQFTRMKNLWEKPEGEQPSIPKKLFDDAKAKHDAAQARQKQAEEAVRYAEERVKESVIRAPYDGVVTRRFVDPGEPVTSTPVTHLIEIQEVGTLVLEFSLPQEMLARIREGTPVTFETEGVPDAKGTGNVLVVFPSIEEATRSFRLRVLVPNSAGLYRPGMLVRVRVVDQEVKDTLVVPRKALIETAAGWQVLAANSDAPVRRSVKPGLVTDDQVEVKEGLREGEKVLVPEGKP